MSVICSEPTNVDTACENDVAINMMKTLFGDDFIKSFYIDNTTHPALVQVAPGDETILSLIASNLSSAALIVALIVIIITIWKGIIGGANDGGAVGFNDKTSLMGLYGRPVFSLAMLMPTASGFPVIYLIIVLITLTFNGITNQGFEAYIDRDYQPQSIAARFDDPNYKSANDMMKPAFYGALHGYCVKYANTNLTADMKLMRDDHFFDPATFSAIAPPTGLLTGISTNLNHSYTLSYVDRESSGPSFFGWQIGRSGIPDDVCGTFTADYKVFQNVATTGLDPITVASTRVSDHVREIGVKISNARADMAQLAYYDAFIETNGQLIPSVNDDSAKTTITGTSWCNQTGQLYGGCSSSTTGGYYAANTGTGGPGWSVNPAEYSDSSLPENRRPNVDVIIDIAQKHTNNLDALIKSQFLLAEGVGVVEEDGTVTAPTANADKFSDQVAALTQETISRGWMAAGTYRTRVQRFRQSVQDALYAQPYNMTFANVVAEEEQEDIQEFIQNIQAVRDRLFSNMERSGQLPPHSDLKTEANIATFDLKGSNPDAVLEGVSVSYAQKLFDAERALIETITGTNGTDNVDAITRMQMTGEIIAGLSLALTVIHKLVLTLIALYQITLGSAGAGFSDFVYDFSNTGDAFRNLYLDTIGGWVSEATDALFSISRLFAVVIPTMPYVFLALAAVGWIMQIIQTAFGMPLFFIMHAIPERTFVGSQAQGWVTLISLAFRPIIILAAFFLSFVIYDPVLTYVSQVYFSLHEGLAASGFDNSISKLFIILSTFKYYWFVYAGIVMMVTYLIFGLVQELGDSVLNWLGTNLLESFGNLETKGVMTGAAQSMAQSASTQKAAKAEAAREKREGAQAAQQSQGGANSGGNNNQAAVAASANQRANTRNANGSMGSSGPAPNTGSNYNGSLGATAIISAGSAATGGARGGAQGASQAYSKASGAMGGGAVGAAVGAAAAPFGAAQGAVRGAFGGAVRGASAFGGRENYRANLAAASSAGKYGAKGALPAMQQKDRANQLDNAFSRKSPSGTGTVLTTAASTRGMGLKPGAVSYGGTPSSSAQYNSLNRVNKSATRENQGKTSKKNFGSTQSAPMRNSRSA